MREVDAYLGLGANLGDRDATLRWAVQRLGTTPGVAVVRTSTLVDSRFAGDGPPQPDYRNGVVHVRTVLPAAAILAIAKALESEAGRRLPAPRNEPRPLDIDILLWGEQRIDARDLVVPHPRLHERAFVTGPLRELGVDVAAIPRAVRPRLVHDPVEFAAICTGWLEAGCALGLVPTMGALHAGHRSLIQAAHAENDRVVATIFVNPLQFGPSEDFAAYPRDLAGDLAVCGAAGADLVFAPSVAQMFAPGFCSHVAVGAAAEGMEGALRPGHFRGVATVVARLFAACRPHRAYFGQKDAQQVAVLRRLVRDLGFPLRLVECPIVREPDGLAMSSRNVYLGPADRRAAPVLHRALSAARSAFALGQRDRDALLGIARTVVLAERRASLDYLELRSEPDLEPLPAGPVAGGRVLIAARFVDGARPVRLLDNLSLGEAMPPS